MRRLLVSLLQSRSGNVLVELAFVAPVLVLLLVGAIDLGRGIYTSMSLRSAARVGAEYVARTGDTANVAAVVAAAANLDPAAVTVTPTSFCECTNGESETCGSTCADGSATRQFITIEARQPFAPILPYPGLSLPSSLDGRAILRVK